MSNNESPRMHFAWPHAPVHHFTGPGAYMVTAGTRQKQPFFDTAQKLDLLLHSLFTYALDFGWQLQAWAILRNHYHFIAIAPDDPATLRKLISKLHTLTARALNQNGSRSRPQSMVPVLGFGDQLRRLLFCTSEICSSQSGTPRSDSKGRKLSVVLGKLVWTEGASAVL